MQPKPSSRHPSRSEPAAERRVPHVGTYTRSLPVSLERLYENALDWEHLPWLHRSSFSSIEIHECGDWGWRAEVGLQPRERSRGVFLELRLDRDRRRWITRTLSGPNAGAEIWTHAFAVEARRTDIVVDFFIPGTEPEDVAVVGQAYRDLYTQLYDEDVSMMTERQQQLDRLKQRAVSGHETLHLGRLEELRPRLPLDVAAAGDPFRVAEVDGQLIVYSLVCPHQLGPLRQAEVSGGVVECPWHGYRFDVRSRRSIRGKACRLAEPPALSVDPATKEVTLEW